MAGNRARAIEDLRVDKAGRKARPGYLQMLFAGGAARAEAADDLRMGRRETIRPGTSRMLFKGGRARAEATEDLRMGRGEETEAEPSDRKMLSDGGEAEDEDDELDGEVSEECIIAAEDIMDVLQGGGFYGDRPSDNDTKVEKASKEASRRAKAKILAQVLKSFVLLARGD